MVFGLGSATKVGAQCCSTLTLFHRCSRIATLFDGFGQVALILGVEEGNFADFVEIETDCVRHGGGTVSSVWGVSCKQILIAFRNGEYELAKEFMLEFQRIIQLVMADIWTFLRKAMLLKYNIDIGPTKAPLGNTHKEWDEQKVIEIMKSLESIVSKLK